MELKNIIPNQFSKGLTILYNNNEVYTIVDFQHVKLGRGDAFMRVKLKNFATGRVLEQTFRSEERVSQVIIREREVTYLYSSGDIFYFMDTNTGTEITLPREKIGEQRYFLKEGDTVTILESGDESMALKLPLFVELEVVKTSPGVKGNTVSGGSKPAELETGLTVNVPLFISEGTILKIDTRTGEYVERVR